MEICSCLDSYTKFKSCLCCFYAINFLFRTSVFVNLDNDVSLITPKSLDTCYCIHKNIPNLQYFGTFVESRNDL